MKYCVIGDTGLLGQAFARITASDKTNEVLGVSTAAVHRSVYWKEDSPDNFQHESLDLLREMPAFCEKLRSFKPRLLLNAAGLADVVASEQNPRLAERLNVDLPGELARVCADEGILFTHISTDQVFDGRKEKPYSEEDRALPMHVYGKTKLKGERKVLSVNADALIVRTNLVGFRGLLDKPTFAEWLCQALFEKKEITLADDFVTSPIHALELSRLILLMAGKKAKGIFNITTEDSVSKYEFGRLLAAALGLDFSEVKKGRLADLNLRPRRPAYLALNVKKTEGFAKINLPHVSETIKFLASEWEAQ